MEKTKGNTDTDLPAGDSRLAMEIRKYLNAGKSQAELAGVIGISQGYMSNILAGRRTPQRISLLAKIASIIGKNINGII